MKKLFSVGLALIMTFSVVFLSETSVRAQSMQDTVQTTKRKTVNATKKTYSKSKRGTKWTRS